MAARSVQSVDLICGCEVVGRDTMSRPQSRLGVRQGAQSYGLFPMNINGTMLMSDAMPKGNPTRRINHCSSSPNTRVVIGNHRGVRKAFHNVCRHRGAKLVQENAGLKEQFSLAQRVAEAEKSVLEACVKKLWRCCLDLERENSALDGREESSEQLRDQGAQKPKAANLAPIRPRGDLGA